MRTQSTVAVFLLGILASSPALAAEEPPSRETLIGERVATLFQLAFARGSQSIPDSLNETKRLYESIQKDAGKSP